MNHSRPIVYSAPGAGLGHLVRACAVSQCLHRLGVVPRIVTHSPYSAGLARLTGCPIDFIPRDKWVAAIPDYAAAVKPEMIVLDTFPWGLRGEWINVPRPRRGFITLARRLKIDAYLAVVQSLCLTTGPHLERVISIEPLADDHLARLQAAGGELVFLPGRIRFPAEDLPTPIPKEMELLLDRGRLRLVVHSGPMDEVAALIRLAEENIRKHGQGDLAVIHPRPLPGLPWPVFEYFPAAGLYARAYRVITGAGYNSLAEMTPWPKKHLCLPFPRRYDDQVGRINNPPSSSANGAAQTANIIMSWLYGRD
ncbi:MAG: hypothetical protein HQK58_00060 [Deltaproteobacteria bacterium]|nr:hypothetical protein [Deltaproteobacteria bacterium]